MRTQEQIIVDCEAHYKKLKREKERRDEDPSIQFPCETCRWFRATDDEGREWHHEHNIRYYGTCTEPLVKGFRKYGATARLNPMPCGPEKALWEPKPSIWQRLADLIDEVLEGMK